MITTTSVNHTSLKFKSYPQQIVKKKKKSIRYLKCNHIDLFFHCIYSVTVINMSFSAK